MDILSLSPIITYSQLGIRPIQKLISNSTDVLIEVVDDGPGFPDDVIKLIGEPYISSKSKKLKSKAGLGLGTFIGKTLLERKKAEINFFNQLDKGAKVEISWKISDLKS